MVACRLGRVDQWSRRLVLSFVFLLSSLSACTNNSQIPEPPLSFPFDTQKAGFKIETDMRVVGYNSFQFGFKLGFKEGDATDRARVKKLAGDHAQDMTGKLIQAGVPIAVRLRINALNPSTLESVFERDFFEERENGASATDFYIVLTEVKLRPGTYHIVIESLKEVPQLQGTTVALYVASDPKGRPISD